MCNHCNVSAWRADRRFSGHCSPTYVAGFRSKVMREIWEWLWRGQAPWGSRGPHYLHPCWVRRNPGRGLGSDQASQGEDRRNLGMGLGSDQASQGEDRRNLGRRLESNQAVHRTDEASSSTPESEASEYGISPARSTKPSAQLHQVETDTGSDARGKQMAHPAQPGQWHFRC